MNYLNLHSWDVTPTEAVRLQHEMAKRICLKPLTGPVRLVAGADISFDLYSDIFYAGFVVIDVSTMETVAKAGAVSRGSMPYVPGLLTFREGPALLKAWERLEVAPDVVVFDGQGSAHPRRMGIASHMGLFLNVPSLGCGKTKLCGQFSGLGENAGDVAPLIHRGENVGAVLRTKTRVNPVFVSPGHLIDLESSLRVLMATLGGYRIPEPTRRAHLYVNELRRAAKASAA